MLFGIAVCLTAVFLLGLDGRFVSPAAYPAICQARAWLLSTGFTLSFGAMFSKVWRVHRLTTKAKSDPKVRMVSCLEPRFDCSDSWPLEKGGTVEALLNGVRFARGGLHSDAGVAVV